MQRRLLFHISKIQTTQKSWVRAVISNDPGGLSRKARRDDC
nr:hypothetical protein [Anaerofilum sp. An201]